MKTKYLQMRDNSSMFALLCVFAAAHINAPNKVPALPDFTIFMTPREHPLTTRSDAPNYSGRVRISGGVASEKICGFRVKGL